MCVVGWLSFAAAELYVLWTDLLQEDEIFYGWIKFSSGGAKFFANRLSFVAGVTSVHCLRLNFASGEISMLQAN